MPKSLTFSISVLVVSNLVPLVGVLLWNWDLFLLMLLYWSETAIIGFWMAISALRYPPDGMHRASVGVALNLPSSGSTPAPSWPHICCFCGYSLPENGRDAFTDPATS